MLYHLSIDARDPERVARTVAELWGGIATPFPPVATGSWIALAGDDRNTALEVYPLGTGLVQGAGDTDAQGVAGGGNDRSATHFAMATDMDAAQVLGIAGREGWPVKYRKRGGAFGVLELWIEGTRMIEVLTPEMQAEYLATMTVAGWQGFLASQGVRAEAA
ncbi:MAG: hypothetical protein WDN24_01175 [Sphingomonas sp.]